MRAVYTLFQTKEGDFLFTFRGSDEQLLLTSLPFADKNTALSRINSIRSLGQRPESFLTSMSPEGKRYFLLRNTRQEIIAQGEMCPDDQSLQKAIEQVRRTSRTGKLLDWTVEK